MTKTVNYFLFSEKRSIVDARLGSNYESGICTKVRRLCPEGHRYKPTKILIIKSLKSIRDHSFIKYATFSENLSFLTPCYVRGSIRG